jgi:hypothetical protein
VSENLLQQRDSEYCEFRELSARVMTWNAGASKPTTLRNSEQDRNFYRELLEPGNPPDILVFGFQELVDLEDKKITAKSIFKRKKHKETSEHEHMSHQYRAWRDHLVRVLDEYSPGQNYILLHTANLVGLFTCVFVKASERNKIRDVCAAEIKLGFSGRVGNKGALVVRFFVDDSSLCFINCHLAAGQTQTVHRNNDAAAIMENAPLPKNRSPADCANYFVGGGDGSMILDHEICILNGGCSGNSDWLWLVRERREESECRGLEAPKARAGQRSGWVVVLLRRVCAVCLTCPSHAVCGRRRPCPLPCTPPVAAAIRHPANYTTRVDDAIAISYTKISPPSYTGNPMD